MDVLGNNIANVNTIGFKMGRAVFQDLMSQTLIGGKTPTDSRGGVNPRQVGSGVYLAGVDNIFASGVLKSTQSTTDLAIQGEGFFVVRGEGAGENYYTRAGDFNFDNTNTLTTPSGYRVQGWLADPETGKLNKEVGVGDIVLGTSYQVMKPKASTEINMSGALNTNAQAAVVTYGKLLTQAGVKQPIDSMLGANGAAMDLADGEKVRISANPTLYTPMSQLCDGDGNPLGISTLNGNITLTINGSTYPLNYESLGGGRPGDGKYTTIEDFIQEVNNIFHKVTEQQLGAGYDGPPIATMSFKNGKFSISANANHAFEINTISGSSSLATILTPLATTYKTGKVETSGTLTYQQEVRYKEDFTNMDEFSDKIDNVINGGVVPNGFDAEFLDNNFGLDEGEGIRFDDIKIYNPVTGTVTATITVGPFTYTENDKPALPNQFHTIQELGRLITDRINEGLAGLNLDTGAVGTRVAFGLEGNKLSFDISGATHNISFGEATLTPAIGGLEPNSYLKMVFDNSLNIYSDTGVVVPKILSQAESSVDIAPISGKGRLVYNFRDSDENTLVDMSRGQFGMREGEKLYFYVNGAPASAALTLTFSATNAAGNFDTAEEFAAQLQTQLRALQIDGAAPFAQATIEWDAANEKLRITNTTPTGNRDLAFAKIETSATSPFFKDMLSSKIVGKTIPADQSLEMDDRSNIADSITGFKITKANKGNIFTDNLFEKDLTGTLQLGKTFTSRQFLTAADENTLMMDTFDENGNYFNFVENQSSLEFKGSIYGEKITKNGYFPIGATSTVADYLLALEKFMDLNGGHNNFDNVTMENGVIKVTGEKGERNNIDYLTITANGGNGDTNQIFNNAMAGTVKPKATGGIEYRTMAIFDEQGNKHNIKFTFSLWNEELNEWRLELATDDPLNDVAINGASQNELIIRFNSDGTLSHTYDRFTTPVKVIPNPTLRFSAANGTNMIDPIALNIGTAGENDGISIAANGGGITKASTDGYQVGDLVQTMFNPAGEIVGTYNNGQTRVLGQVALATFVNNRGLEKVGDTMFGATGASGQATIGEPMTGDRGEIAASMLENSNVDLSVELVTMITTQRAYQSNSKVISTSDEMIQELLNMKR